MLLTFWLLLQRKKKEEEGREEEVNLTNSAHVSASWVPVVKIRLHFGSIFYTELLCLTAV